MQEIIFKDAEDAKQAVLAGEIEEGDWIIDDERNLELYITNVYTEIESVHEIALLCREQLYDANNECAIGLGDVIYFITPFVLAHFRVEKENDE